jgi:hypothetical protein
MKVGCRGQTPVVAKRSEAAIAADAVDAADHTLLEDGERRLDAMPVLGDVRASRGAWPRQALEPKLDMTLES